MIDDAIKDSEDTNPIRVIFDEAYRGFYVWSEKYVKFMFAMFQDFLMLTTHLEVFTPQQMAQIIEYMMQFTALNDNNADNPHKTNECSVGKISARCITSRIYDTL